MKHTKALRTILLGLLLLPALIACSNQSKNAEAALHTVVAHVKAGDFTSMAAHTTNFNQLNLLDADLVSMEALAAAASHHLKVEILETKVTGSTATIRMRGTNASIASVVNQMFTFGNMMLFAFAEPSEEQISQMLIENVRRDDAPTRTTEVTATLKKQGGKWLIEAPSSSGLLPPFWDMIFAYGNDF